MNGFLRIGQLPYLNTLPFSRLGGMESVIISTAASPRRLGQWARENQVDAGPVPVVDAWELEGLFEPAGDFGIAVREKAKSVLLYSRRPWQELDGEAIGITDQTSTSARLLQILLKERGRVSCPFKEGFHEEDAARLVIGDEALKPLPGFPCVLDLGEEWSLWQKKPFVFARWIVRKTAPSAVKQRLRTELEKSLRNFEGTKDEAILSAARGKGFSPAEVRDYLSGFIFKLGREEKIAENLFRQLVEEKLNYALEPS